MKFKFFTLLVAILSIGMVQAQQGRIKFTEYDLPNGLHVILHQDNSTPIVAVTISYHVGSKNENPERTGFAHFFEHLMFEGSANIKRGEYTDIVTNAGGELNANTWFDRTFYYEVLPSNELELGLWLESERLLHLRIDSVGVATQRSTIKEEMKQTADNRPYGTWIQEIIKRAYTVHPYRWRVIGTPEHLDAATLQEFMDFHSTYYVPNNAILSIAGDINMEQTKKLIEKYYGDIPRGTKPIYRPTIVEPEQKAEIRDNIYDAKIQLPAVIEAYHMPAMGTPDFYSISMLTTLLSDGESSRLTKSLVDKQQKALAVQAFPLALEQPGLFCVFALPTVGGDINELEKLIDAEFDKVKTNEIDEMEFQKLRNKVETDYIQKSTSVSNVAEGLSDSYMYFKNTNMYNTELDEYMKVTKADLKRVANKYLTKENRVVLHYLPKPAEQQ